MGLSARMAAVEMIHAGTTGFIDAGSYFMEEAADVYARSGLRGALSYSTMDQEGLPASIAMDARTAVQKTDELYKEFHGQENIKVYYSLRSLISCSEDLILMAAERAAGNHTMLQAHMNEYPGKCPIFRIIHPPIALDMGTVLYAQITISISYTNLDSLKPFAVARHPAELCGFHVPFDDFQRLEEDFFVVGMEAAGGR